MTQKLSLIAHDKDDLHILASYLQDSVVKSSDMQFIASRRLFCLMLNRYCWEESEKSHQRIRTAMHFSSVMNAKSFGINKVANQVFSLLTIQFDITDNPAGTVRLIFSGYTEICLMVETLNVVMQDVTEGWKTAYHPHHD